MPLCHSSALECSHLQSLVCHQRHLIRSRRLTVSPQAPQRLSLICWLPTWACERGWVLTPLVQDILELQFCCFYDLLQHLVLCVNSFERSEDDRLLHIMCLSVVFPQYAHVCTIARRSYPCTWVLLYIFYHTNWLKKRPRTCRKIHCPRKKEQDSQTLHSRVACKRTARSHALAS